MSVARQVEKRKAFELEGHLFQLSLQSDLLLARLVVQYHRQSAVGSPLARPKA